MPATLSKGPPARSARKRVVQYGIWQISCCSSRAGVAFDAIGIIMRDRTEVLDEIHSRPDFSVYVEHEYRFEENVCTHSSRASASDGVHAHEAGTTEQRCRLPTAQRRGLVTPFPGAALPRGSAGRPLARTPSRTVRAPQSGAPFRCKNFRFRKTCLEFRRGFSVFLTD